jgi:hypothetical protein
LDGFDAGAVVPLGSQQPLPAMCQAQPKLSIVFVMRVRGEFSALLDLVLEEIGCFYHAITTTKAPLTGASIDQKRNKSVFVPKDQTQRGRPIEPLAGSEFVGLEAYRRLHGRECSIGCGIGR